MNARLAFGRAHTRLKYLNVSRNRRRLGATVALVLGLGVAWIVVTGYLARQQAATLAARIQQAKVLISQGQVTQADQVAEGIPKLARRVHELTTGPAWWTAAHVPYLGDPLQVTRSVAEATDRIGNDAIPILLHAASALNPQTLRASGSTIRTAPLVAARPELARAAVVVDAADASLRSTSSTTWLGLVNRKRDALVSQLGSIRGYVDAAARASRILPSMLGDSGPQHYFIGLQNEAELRGTGGLPGAFAIATADHGKITFTRFESDALLLPARTDQLVRTGLDFGKDYTATYGASDPTNSYLDSNVSPDFPYAAQIWAAMWQKVSGQRVDGVIAVDPTTLGYFLNVVGPAALPSGQQITGANVVSLTEKDEYANFPDVAQRKKYLVAVLKAAADRLTSGSGSAYGLVQAASLASSQRRLLVWSRDPSVENVLAASDYAGAIPRTSAAFSGVVLNNSAGGKLDYYLQRSVTYSRTGCGSSRDVIVTIALTNTAPAGGLPSYVTERLDKAPASSKPGDYSTLLDYYATKGALLESVSLNGTPTTAAEETASGHPIFRMSVQLPRGTTQTVVLHLTEPPGSNRPEIWTQPGVTPLAVQVLNQSCH